MTVSENIHSLSLVDIADKCSKQTKLYFKKEKYDSRYCYELFRRAILEQQQRAWELIYSQYSLLATSWIQRHSFFRNQKAELDFFINRSFEKMWSALTPEKFNKFPNLQSILRYLQMCVHSVLTDNCRKREREKLVMVDCEIEPEPEIDKQSAEKEALKGIELNDLWNYLKQCLKDEKEYTVVYETFVFAHEPGDIADRFPELFKDVKDVYRVKENVVARLKRNKHLREMLNS